MRKNEGRWYLTRRDFVKGAGISALSLSLSSLNLKSHGAVQPEVLYPYRNWEEIYRKKWTWDKIAKSSHNVNCWPQGGCNFNIYVKDGIVWREEQAATYPQTNPDVPDFNPKGCQKGCSFSHRMYDPGRIKYPLKRVGNRGEGKWKRMSWDDALTEIADNLIDTLIKEGPDTILWDLGTNFDFGITLLGLLRFVRLTDSFIIDMNPEIGDDFHGAAITLGKIHVTQSDDDWFYADLILLWGGNPFYTRIPNCHFFLEAKYNGTKLISICPDYNPSSIHSDLWVPVNMGTDAALALSMAQVIIQKKLYNQDFIREQTDLPLLVRTDTKTFLREKDLKKEGAEDRFYFFDLATKDIKIASQDTLSLNGAIPSLEGEYEVEIEENKKVKVSPVFQLLKESLDSNYPPEKASQICGTNPDLIRMLAEEVAKAKAVTYIQQTNFSKYYHGSLMERAVILVFALCGHLGKRGSGVSFFGTLTCPDAAQAFAAMPPFPPEQALKELEKQIEPFIKPLKEKGYTDEMIIHEQEKEACRRKQIISATLFWYFNGLKESMGRTKEWDPFLKRDLDDYINEALEKGWQFIEPKPGKDPKIIFECGGNFLRRVRGYDRLEKNLLPKLKLLVSIDWRMSHTNLHSDYILPTASWYEENEYRYTILTPYHHVTTKAVEPLGESKSEWDIYCLILKKVQERAKQRNILTFKDRVGKERRLDNIYADFTFGGYYKEEDSEKLLRDLFKFSSNMDVGWDELKEKGIARYPRLGKFLMEIENATDWKDGETITPFKRHTEKKMVWPTFTRRIQFYIDHPFFLELREELPLHKDNPPIGGHYPLQMTGGHTRWSIHASWRDHSHMLRLQRGGPIMYMNSKDAEAREIKDGDRVRVRNDIGSFEIMAKLSPTVKPGQVIVYHAWEPYQFINRKSHQSLIPSPINPIELAGGYFHIQPVFMAYNPGQCDRGTRVEVKKLK